MKWIRYIIIALAFLLFVKTGFAQIASNTNHFTIGRLRYSGGGDWYNNPSCIPNLLDFISNNANIQTADDEVRVSIMDEHLFSIPVLFMTGHGRVSFAPKEAERLRVYLTNGGFLYADDDYGMDEHFRREMKKVFPDKQLVEIPFSHEIFHNHFDFPNGLPKIHKHDEKSPQAFGYFHNGRLVVFYTIETNISDGWADPDVHGDPPDVREQALKMGLNIIKYALTH